LIGIAPRARLHILLGLMSGVRMMMTLIMIVMTMMVVMMVIGRMMTAFSMRSEVEGGQS
jgi:hypothetical protein